MTGLSERKIQQSVAWQTAPLGWLFKVQHFSRRHRCGDGCRQRRPWPPDPATPNHRRYPQQAGDAMPSACCGPLFIIGNKRHAAQRRRRRRTVRICKEGISRADKTGAAADQSAAALLRPQQRSLSRRRARRALPAPRRAALRPCVRPDSGISSTAFAAHCARYPARRRREPGCNGSA